MVNHINVVAGQLGGIALNVGGAIGASALQQLNQDLVESNGGPSGSSSRGSNPLTMTPEQLNDEAEERSTAYGAKGAGYVSKAGKQMYRHAKELFGPDETTHGKDLSRSLGLMVPGALQRADKELDELWKRKKDLDEGVDSKDLDDRIRSVRQLRFDLEAKYQTWQREQAKAGKDDELEGMTSDATPVLQAMMALDRELDKEV